MPERTRGRLPLLAAVLVLAATDAARAGDPVLYRCDDDSALTVTFVAQPPSAIVADGGLIFLLTQQPAASGARYVADNPDGRLEFWTKGDEATFETPGGTRRNCRVVAR